MLSLALDSCLRSCLAVLPHHPGSASEERRGPRTDARTASPEPSSREPQTSSRHCCSPQAGGRYTLRLAEPCTTQQQKGKGPVLHWCAGANTQGGKGQCYSGRRNVHTPSSHSGVSAMQRCHMPHCYGDRNSQTTILLSCCWREKEEQGQRRKVLGPFQETMASFGHLLQTQS